ncbi:MAG: MFS transporter [Rhodospirillales bacterium]|nr:MFS transporter [Rhodospirillales bacterium]
MSFLEDIRITRAPLMGFIAMGIFWGVWSALIPQVKADIGADDADLGRALVFVAMGAIPAMIAGGRLSDRFGPWLLPFSIALFGLASVLPALAATPVSLSVLLLMLGAASGFMDVVMNGRVSVLEGQSRSPLMQLNHGTFAITFFAAAALTGLLRAHGITVTSALIVVSLTILLLVWPAHKGLARPDSGEKPRVRKRILSLLIVLFGLIAFTAFLVENGMQSWSALHLERTLGAAPSIGGLGPGLLALAIAAGRFAGQALGRRINDGTLLMGAAMVGTAGAIIFGAAPSIDIALIGVFLCGAGVSVVAPAGFSLAGRSVSADRRGSAVAAASVIAYAGFFVGPAVIGSVSDRLGLPAAIFTMAMVVAAIVPLWLIARSLGSNTREK